MTNRKGGYGDKTSRYDAYEDWLPQDEYLKFITDVFTGYDKVVKKNGVVIFNFNYSVENPSLPYLLAADVCNKTKWKVADTIIWKKRTAIPHPASYNRLNRIFEFVMIFAREDEMETFFMNKEVSSVGENGQNYYKIYNNYIEADNNDESVDLNKATFSTEFVRKMLMLYSKKGNLVYDSFMGTGTTAEASLIEGMNFIGSELSSDQCDYANKRINNRLSKPTLF